MKAWPEFTERRSASSAARADFRREITRRRAIETLALGPAALGLGGLACGSGRASRKPDTATTGAADAKASLDQDAATDGSPAGGSGWATGGTAAMKGGYSDPFGAGLGPVCALTCAKTLGPCYADTITRKDVSEGQGGVPVRLAFLILDEACRPLPGASLDIWHTSPAGLYSGSDAVAMCTQGDAGARAARWFRGVQAADASGRVDFDSCFPGWYPGRTIHVHFTVRVGNRESVTSQFFFDDALADEILATQPIYKDRGPRDTTNRNDNVISPAAVPAYSMQTRRMPDGAMLAWKAIVLRSSSAAPCTIPGGMPGGMGG